MNGIVMEINNDKAIIFQKNGAITEIRNRDYKVGQKIKIISYSHKRVMAAAACCAAFLASGVSGYAVYNIPSDYIYVDINPSIRLDLNCFEKVINVVPLNEDAENLISEYSFKEKNAEKCIDEIVNSCIEKQYINDGNTDIEIDVAADKEKLSGIINETSERLKSKNLVVDVNSVSKEENEDAINNKVSPKRLRAVKDYTEMYGGSLEENTEKLRGTSTKEIYAEIGNIYQKQSEGSENQNKNDLNTSENSGSFSAEDSRQNISLPEKRNETHSETGKNADRIKESAGQENKKSSADKSQKNNVSETSKGKTEKGTDTTNKERNSRKSSTKRDGGENSSASEGAKKKSGASSRSGEVSRNKDTSSNTTQKSSGKKNSSTSRKGEAERFGENSQNRGKKSNTAD